jgi:hypothetical protein
MFDAFILNHRSCNHDANTETAFHKLIRKTRGDANLNKLKDALIEVFPIPSKAEDLMDALKFFTSEKSETTFITNKKSPYIDTIAECNIAYKLIYR